MTRINEMRIITLRRSNLVSLRLPGYRAVSKKTNVHFLNVFP